MPDLRRILVCPDAHHPYVDTTAWKVFLKVAKALHPEIIVVIGDFADCLAVSAYPIGPERRRNLEYEIDLVNEALRALEAASPKSRRIYCLGNHEHRLERYIRDKAPELFGLVDIKQLLQLKQHNWQVVAYKDWITLGKVAFTHDLERSGMNAAQQTLRDFGGNIVFGHCLPLNYDVATTLGWKPLCEMTPGDSVLAYSGGQIVESIALEKLEFAYTGPMACFESRSITQRMTAEHHLYTADDRYLSIRDALARNVGKADLVHAAEPLHSRTESPISDGMLRLVIAYCADGSLDRGRYIRFHIKKERKIRRLNEILNSLEVAPSWGPRGSNGGRKLHALPRNIADALLALAPAKQLPQWLLQLSERQRQIVIDELPFWDGTHLEYGRQFQSTKSEERDLVQLLLLQGGILSSSAHKGVITWTPQREANGNAALSKLVRWENCTKEPVGCITTPHRNFIVRTPSGRVEVTGNSHRAAVYYEGTTSNEHRVALNVGWLGDANQIDYRHKASVLRASQLGFGWVVQDVRSGNSWCQFVPIIGRVAVVDGKKITA